MERYQNDMTRGKDDPKENVDLASVQKNYAKN